MHWKLQEHLLNSVDQQERRAIKTNLTMSIGIVKMAEHFRKGFLNENHRTGVGGD
jgi:hypothetical protein